MVDSMKGGRATYQDILDAPEHVVAELVDGELFLSPRPATPHAVTTLNLSDELISLRRGSGGGPGTWFFLVEPELHFGANVVVPDIAGWRIERMPPDLTATFLSTPPDWICEALSRSTERVDRLKKLPIYASAGVGHVWLLDERIRKLEVHRLGTEIRRYDLVEIYTEGSVVRAEPFTELELRLANLFRYLPTRASEAYVDYGR